MSRAEDNGPKRLTKLSKSSYQEELNRCQFDLERWHSGSERVGSGLSSPSSA
jgi:hypothetical protein